MTPDSTKTQLQVLREYVEAPLLLLDDIGTEKPSEWTVRTLTTILDQRDGAGALTIITTNCRSLSEIAQHLAADSTDKVPAERIVDRMRGISKLFTFQSTSSFRETLPAIGMRNWATDDAALDALLSPYLLDGVEAITEEQVAFAQPSTTRARPRSAV